MYSDKKNVLQLVSLLKAHHICQIVVSPGSRNSPVIHSLAGDSFFTCHTVTDERSAGFYALGIARYTGETVAVCCTSGTAVLNYGPAVAEAYYQQLPLVVITADRPAAWIDQMAGQTLPQPGIFNSLVKKSVQLPEITSREDEWYCNRLINEAILDTNHHGCGPVHINIPLSEPLFESTVKQLPEARKITRTTTSANYIERFAGRYERPLIMIGQMPGCHFHMQLSRLLSDHKCVILAEHLSNIPPEYGIRNFDAMLCSIAEDEQEEWAPDLLITMGGHILSKRIRHFLRAHPPLEHWHVSPTGAIVDSFQCLTDVIEMDERAFIGGLPEQTNTGQRRDAFCRQWLGRSLRIPEPAAREYSDMMIAGRLIKSLPPGAILQLANSSSVRLAQLFHLRSPHRVFSNRGTNGIDGCLSTTIGQAAVSEGLTFLLIGDLAFFYDMNVLWNRSLPPRLRILLNNNGGGGIFYTLPGLGKSGIMEKHLAVGHSLSARAWAEDQGFTYLSVSNEQELQEQMPVFVCEKGDKPILMEAFTSKEKNAELLRNYYRSLRGIKEK
ncbi:MAG: 2-succinyl-5-enolpyruvyl-6-hydroxy-3-cyclohexene-1-carboxylic-acid synthase [Tannerellaceae bacterium]|jgi:2-succinyl-5-enolpyruvyl-6-hydroxy-3-cyclohexene-1-carboxylate synthase|nr:2-succinyl-5-enolpyruvyl-6-hydroxy-3-cyclohexene-1-carboxylic-acid synthase [Tannerellaceae bacterium]